MVRGNDRAPFQHVISVAISVWPRAISVSRGYDRAPCPLVVSVTVLFWPHATSVVRGDDLAPFQLVVSVAMLSGHMPLREFQWSLYCFLIRLGRVVSCDS